MTDDKLLRKLQAQNPEALEELMERYDKLVYTVISNILGASQVRSDVEELVSDTFYSVWTHAGNIQPGNLRAYLCTTARNKAKSYLRSRRPLPMDLDTIALSDTAPSPEDEAMDQELSRLLKKAIGGMRPRDREIFLRYYYYLETAESIGAAMSIPPATVRSCLSRGRKRLQKILDKEALF